MNRLSLILFLGLALGSAASSTQAATISYTTTTPIPTTLTDWSSSLSFPQFNPSCGTLLSVELRFSSSLTTTLTVINQGITSSSGNAKTDLQVTIQDAGNNLTVPQIDLLSPAFAYNLDADQQVTSGLLSNSGSSDDTYTASAILSEFIGGGNIILPVSTFTQTLLANTGGNTASSQVTNASATGTVTYTYVPEPASLSLLVLGGLAMLRRRT